MNVDLAILFVEYYKEKYAGSFQQLRDYLGGVSDDRKLFVIIDNREESPAFDRLADHVVRIKGDNRCGEFSGWQAGRDFLEANGVVYSAALLANDSFLKPGPSYLRDYPAKSLLERSVRQQAIIGRLDSHGKDLSAWGFDFDSWVCTNCFFVPRDALSQIGSLVTVGADDLDRFLPPSMQLERLENIQVARADLDAGSFDLKLEIPPEPTLDLRFDVEPTFVPSRLGIGDDQRHLGFYVTSLNLVTERIAAERTWHGWYPEGDGIGWVGRSASARFASGGRLELTGWLPDAAVERLEPAGIKIEINRHSPYFVDDAPISTAYRRVILDWLTEGWHSRIRIVPDNWSLVRRKVQAILNEGLLTARFEGLGFSPESYGRKKYY